MEKLTRFIFLFALIFSAFSLNFLLDNKAHAATTEVYMAMPGYTEWRKYSTELPQIPSGYVPLDVDQSRWLIIHPSTGNIKRGYSINYDWFNEGTISPITSGYIPAGSDGFVSGYPDSPSFYIMRPTGNNVFRAAFNFSGWVNSGAVPTIPNGYVPIGRHDNFTFIVNPSTGSLMRASDGWNIFETHFNGNLPPIPSGFMPFGSEYGQFFIVTKPNSAPTNTTIPAQAITGKGQTKSVNLNTYFTDPDGDSLTYTVSSNNTTNVSVSLSGSTLTLTGNKKGSATITVTASDGKGGTKPTTFTASVNNSAPTTPTLTVPTSQFEHGDPHILSWNATDVDNDTLTYTLEVSYNNGSTWTQLYNGANKNYTFTVPSNQTQVNFRVRAYDGAAYSAYKTDTNKTIREVMYYWSKYTNVKQTNQTTKPVVKYTSSSSYTTSNNMVSAGYTGYSLTQVGGTNAFNLTGYNNNPITLGPNQSGIMYHGTSGSVFITRFTFIRDSNDFVTTVNEDLMTIVVETVNEGTYDAKGSLISSNIQAGYNAYINNALNPDGFWWVRGQRILSGDISPPIIELTEQTPYGATSTITVKTFDTSAISATKWVKGNQPLSYFVSNGTNVSIGAFTVTQNGVYTVYAKDLHGNEAVETITVTKVDVTNPTGILVQTPSEFTNQQVVITAVGNDAESGIKQIKLPNGNDTTDPSVNHVVAGNGLYTFVFEDYAGNVTTESITISNIDKTAPSITFTPEERKADLTDIDVQTAIADSGVSGYKAYRYVWSKEETKPTEGWSEWNATNNPLITQSQGGKWVLHIEAMDNAGNIGYAFSGLYEKIVLSGGPSVNINVFPLPTGQWVAKPIDVYVMDNGDSELLAKSNKFYEVTNSPLYPTNFSTAIPLDKKIQLNLEGENFVHVQYILDDGTKISSTAGPYLIDTGALGDFEMKLVNSIGDEITNWSNVPLKLVMSNSSSVSVSGSKKQYRIEGLHTDWQPYADGTMITHEGDYRIFGRIISGTGVSSPQQVVNTKIDQTNPTITSLRLVRNTDNTYDVRLKAEDALSGVNKVKLNNGTSVPFVNNNYEISGLSAKPTSVSVTDTAGNSLSSVPFATEPTITFDAPYTLTTPLYRSDVIANLTNATGYMIGNRAYTCSSNPCKVTLSYNTTLIAVRIEGTKETKTSVKIENIDQSDLQVVLNGKRNSTTPKEITFTWNYALTNATLTCNEDGQTKNYAVTGKSFSFNGKNYTYSCAVTGDYKGIILTSNTALIYPDGSIPSDETTGTTGREKTTNIQLEETRLGKAYIINGRSDNYKHNTLPIPVNEITAD